MALLCLLLLFETGRIQLRPERFCNTLPPFRVKNHFFLMIIQLVRVVSDLKPKVFFGEALLKL